MIPDSLFLPFSKSLFLPSQSPVSPFSKSLFRPVQSPVPVLSVLFLPLSSSPILPDSRSRPLPSSSKPKKTAERHEAVPPFLAVVGSKMEHDSFTYRSSTVCSRTACKLGSGCSYQPTASRSCRKCIGSLQCQARNDYTSSSTRKKSPCHPSCLPFRIPPPPHYQ